MKEYLFDLGKTKLRPEPGAEPVLGIFGISDDATVESGTIVGAVLDDEADKKWLKTFQSNAWARVLEKAPEAPFRRLAGTRSYEDFEIHSNKDFSRRKFLEKVHSLTEKGWKRFTYSWGEKTNG